MNITITVLWYAFGARKPALSLLLIVLRLDLSEVHARHNNVQQSRREYILGRLRELTQYIDLTQHLFSQLGAREDLFQVLDGDGLASLDVLSLQYSAVGALAERTNQLVLLQQTFPVVVEPHLVTTTSLSV